MFLVVVIQHTTIIFVTKYVVYGPKALNTGMTLTPQYFLLKANVNRCIGTPIFKTHQPIAPHL
jgi:hypothetical protein